MNTKLITSLAINTVAGALLGFLVGNVAYALLGSGEMGFSEALLTLAGKSNPLVMLLTVMFGMMNAKYPLIDGGQR